MRRITSGQGNLKESGTENIPLASRRLNVWSGPAQDWAGPLQSKVPRVFICAGTGDILAFNRREGSKGEKVR